MNAMRQFRRMSPRVGIEAMCWELTDKGDPGSAMSIDLSAFGLCIERPYMGHPTPRDVQLEIEVPGIDEVMWARGEASFDVLLQTTPGGAGGRYGIIRRTGYRLARAASRDLRMLREFVVETHRAHLDLSRDYTLALS